MSRVECAVEVRMEEAKRTMPGEAPPVPHHQDGTVYKAECLGTMRMATAM